jgi:hypothetical protein
VERTEINPRDIGNVKDGNGAPQPGHIQTEIIQKHSHAIRSSGCPPVILHSVRCRVCRGIIGRRPMIKFHRIAWGECNVTAEAVEGEGSELDVTSRSESRNGESHDGSQFNAGNVQSEGWRAVPHCLFRHPVGTTAMTAWHQ